MKRTAIFSGGYVERFPIQFGAERWANMRRRVPELPAEKDDELRDAISIACGGYLTRRGAVEMGEANAAALSGGAKELSEFERFAKALRVAASSWEALRGVYDDQLSDVRRFDELADMAADADRRLAALRALGEPTPIAGTPWRHFVGSLFKVCRRLDLKPTVMNRLYDDETAKPTWFQEFVLAVNDHLLGEQGYKAASTNAFHAETVAAVRAVRSGEAIAG
jgi:hypothetical protein